MSKHETDKALDLMTEPELKALFDKLCERIKWTLPPGTGFIVLAGAFGPNSVAQYASNVEREDAEAWMLETMYRWNRRDFVERVKSQRSE